MSATKRLAPGSTDAVLRSTLTVVPKSEPEAEMICGLLRSAEIVCDHRATQSGVKFGGPQEVLVRPEDLEAARALLAEES